MDNTKGTARAVATGGPGNLATSERSGRSIDSKSAPASQEFNLENLCIRFPDGRVIPLKDIAGPPFAPEEEWMHDLLFGTCPRDFTSLNFMVGARIAIYVWEGKPVPDARNIADGMGRSERGVRKSIAKLKTRGWLSVDDNGQIGLSRPEIVR